MSYLIPLYGMGMPSGGSGEYLAAPLGVLQEVASNKILAIDTGAYVVSGQTVGLRAGRTLGITTGAYTISGKPITFEKTYILSVTTGAYVVTGYDATLPNHYVLSILTGRYLITGNDATLSPSYHIKATFAEFQNEAFLDWGTTDYNSYLAISQSDDAIDVKEQVPYVYTFLKETADSDENSEGATITGFWDWANDTSSPRVTAPAELYQFRNGFLVCARRHKMRGRGRQLQLRFDSEAGKNFNLLGWAVYYTHNAQQ